MGSLDPTAELRGPACFSCEIPALRIYFRTLLVYLLQDGVARGWDDPRRSSPMCRCAVPPVPPVEGVRQEAGGQSCLVEAWLDLQCHWTLSHCKGVCCCTEYADTRLEVLATDSLGCNLAIVMRNPATG